MFSKSPFSNLEPDRLRWLMWLFFIAMALPTTVLVYKSYDQLKWEAFYQHRQQAEELAARIDKKFSEFVELEESRSFSDYSFIVVEGNDVVNYVERSALSQFPIANDNDGVVGYFQIDVDGNFSSPLLPASSEIAARYGLSENDLEQRRASEKEVESILSSNQLVKAQSPQVGALTSSQVVIRDDYLSQETGSSTVAGQLNLNQAAFDKLSDIKKSSIGTKTKNHYNRNSSEIATDSVLERLEELELDSPYKQKIDEYQNEAKQRRRSAPVPRKGRDRKVTVERSLASVQGKQAFSDSSASLEVLDNDNPPKIKIFESEVDPFEISLLESGHFVMYRKVWRDGQRYIQGLLLEQTAFIDDLVRDTFSESLLAQMSTLTLIYQGNLLMSFDNTDRRTSRINASQFDGTLLYRSRLSEPFTQLDSIFTIRSLPAGPGGKVIIWAAIILGVVLSIGVFLLYRMSLRNLDLVNQQQNFVSAVSHELKTPLTSIRMYGEILQQGWADEKQKKGYYRYIFDESERLTRLINNVLALARMTRNETHVDLKTISVSELIDIIHSKVDSQIERAEFKLNLSVTEQVALTKLKVDPDVFAQIVINLVDNAIKFSCNAENKVIDIDASLLSNDRVCFSIRDYGPGIADGQLKKIFELFYRSEDELTRETTGTGIGLALVNQLTQLMNGEIDVINRKVGAEFKVSFSAVPHSPAT